jgi:hypothetical protein
MSLVHTLFDTLHDLFELAASGDLFRGRSFSRLASLGGFLVAVTLVMGMISLTVLNGKAVKGYQLNELEQERQVLTEDGEITEMLTLRARSMDVIEQKSGYMLKPSREAVTYVMPVTVVAQNDSEMGF